MLLQHVLATQHTFAPAQSQCCHDNAIKHSGSILNFVALKFLIGWSLVPLHVSSRKLPMPSAFCNICGRHVSDTGAYVESGCYEGMYICAGDALTAKQLRCVRHLLHSCCLPTQMPGVLNIFTTHPELNSVLARFLKFSKLEIACHFRRFVWPHVVFSASKDTFLAGRGIPPRISDTILEYLLRI